MIKIEVDTNLTPENCEEKGYEWWTDSIYDPEAPVKANQDFVEMIKEGWKVGKSASTELEKNGGVGLYRPHRPLTTPPKSS